MPKGESFDKVEDFNVIGLPQAAELPSVRWKLLSLEKLKAQNPENAQQRREIEEIVPQASNGLGAAER